MAPKEYIAPRGYSNAEDVQRRRKEIETALAVNRAKAQEKARGNAGQVTNDIAGTMVAEGYAKMPIPEKPARGSDIAEQHSMDTVMNVALAAVNTAHGVKAQTRFVEPSHEALVSDQVNRILNPPELPEDYDYEDDYGDLPDFAAEVDQEMQSEYGYDSVQESVDEINQYRAAAAEPEAEEWDPWVEDDYEEED